MTGHAVNIWARLEEMSRSPEQDMVIRRLLNAGFEMRSIDVAKDPRGYKRGFMLIFRDRTGQRWVVDRQGNMSVAGVTDWQVVTT